MRKRKAETVLSDTADITIGRNYAAWGYNEQIMIFLNKFFMYK